jgi:hypothetical protein
MAESENEMIFTAHASRPGIGRLLWVFVQSLAASALVASALYAALYVAQDMRARDAAVAPAAPSGAASTGPGLELLTPFADAASLGDAAGFAPVLPSRLPAGVGAPKFDATQPDASGGRSAEIRYAAPRDDAGHVAGPSLLLVESRSAADGGTGAIAQDAATGRYASVISCKGIRVAATLFFPASTSQSAAASQAAQFFAGLTEQCR